MKFSDFIKNYSNPLKLNTKQINDWLMSANKKNRIFLDTKFIRMVNMNNALYAGIYKDKSEYSICYIQVLSDVRNGFRIEPNQMSFGETMDDEKQARDVLRRI